MKIPLTFLLAHASLFCAANDGAFRANGNQLIPMYETDISVKKEILTIQRTGALTAQITVYYEFFNPKDADKTLEVGFEAFSPSGDASKMPAKNGQPFITHFTVNLNGMDVPYLVSIVKDSLYYRNGKYKTISLAQATKESDESDEVDFFYVYHFHAVFRPGLNILQHTYTVGLSSSVVEHYSLEYVLTAAKRWANRQIDDFTLRIDMGAFQDICIDNDFFKDFSQWQIDGVGKGLPLKEKYTDGHDKECEKLISQFFIRKGQLIFKATNFKPAGELYLYSRNNYYYESARKDVDVDDSTWGMFNFKRDILPFSLDDQKGLREPVNETSKRILRNLPFARRGYVFKDPELQTYYERMPWYMPDSTYKP